MVQNCLSRIRVPMLQNCLGQDDRAHVTELSWPGWERLEQMVQNCIGQDDRAHFTEVS